MCEAQERNGALYFPTPNVCVCVGYLVYIWTEVGVGAASLAAVSVEGGREGACRILCVSSLSCLAEVHLWQMSKSPPTTTTTGPQPPLLPLSLPGLSSSFVSER